MIAHNIVTNSYSCGIGEQNQNALMMGNMKTEYFMNTEIKKIQALTKDESNHLRGGFTSIEHGNVETDGLWNSNCSKDTGLIGNGNCGCDKCCGSIETPEGQE